MHLRYAIAHAAHQKLCNNCHLSQDGFKEMRMQKTSFEVCRTPYGISTMLHFLGICNARNLSNYRIENIFSLLKHSTRKFEK